MVKHREFEDLLSRYVNRELESDEREAVQRHLAECDRCRQLLADLEFVNPLIAELSPVSTVALSTSDDILRRVADSTRQRRAGFALDRVWAYAGTGLAIALIGAFLLVFNLMLKASGGNLTGPETAPPSLDFGDVRILGETQLTQRFVVSSLEPLSKGDAFLSVFYGGGGPQAPLGVGKFWLVDPSGVVTILAEDPMPLGDGLGSLLTVSPDGNAIAYVAMEGDESFIAVYDVKTGRKRKVLEGVGGVGKDHLGPIISWTPDGRIIFQRNDFLWQVGSDGSNPEQLTTESLIRKTDTESIWGYPSHDGRYVISAHDVYTPGVLSLSRWPGMPLTRTWQLQPVAGGKGFAVDGSPVSPAFVSTYRAQSVWSPDGNKLLIVRPQAQSRLSLIVVDVQTGAETVLLDDVMKLGTYPGSFEWSPDGKLLFVSARVERSAGGGLYVLDASGKSEPKLIGEMGKEYQSLRWLPDGSGFLFTRGQDVWIAVLDPGREWRGVAENKLRRLRMSPWPVVLK